MGDGVDRFGNGITYTPGQLNHAIERIDRMPGANRMKPPDPKYKDHPRDSLSKLVKIFSADGREDRGCYHFYTKSWCWRESHWKVVRWEKID